MKPGTLNSIAAFLFSLNAVTAHADCDKEIVKLSPATLTGAGAVAQLFRDFAKISLNDARGALWPGYTWKDKRMVLVVREPNAAGWLWDAKTGEVSEIHDQTILGLSPGNFKFQVLNGVDTLIVSGKNLDAKPLDDTFGLAIHEGFHQWMQKNWKKTPSHGRGEQFPAEFKPRYYRRMVFDALYAAYLDENNRDAHLGAASFWHRKWSSEYPEDKLLAPDQLEGTARYAENKAIAMKGSSQENWASAMKELLTDRSRHALALLLKNAPDQNVTPESYDIGFLSSLLLDITEKDQRWFKEIEGGQNPTDLLLSKRKSVETADSETLLKTYEAAVARRNGRIQADLGSFLPDYASSEFFRLFIPKEWSLGSFSPKYFVRLVHHPELQVVPLAVDRFLQSPDGKTKVTLKKDSVFYTDSTDQKLGIWVLIKKSDVNGLPGAFNVSNALMTIEAGQGEVTDNKDGFQQLNLR